MYLHINKRPKRRDNQANKSYLSCRSPTIPDAVKSIAFLQFHWVDGMLRRFHDPSPKRGLIFALMIYAEAIDLVSHAFPIFIEAGLGGL